MRSEDEEAGRADDSDPTPSIPPAPTDSSSLGDGSEPCLAAVDLPPLPSYSRGSRHLRRHHRHRRRNIFRFKRKESNILAAVVNIIVMLLLCVAMAEPQWFYLRGGGCRQGNPQLTPETETVHYLGVTQFLFMGKFTSGLASYKYGPGPNLLFECVTPEVVSLMKALITLLFLGILFSLLSFLADLTGPTYRPFKILRRNGIISIVVVVLCIILNGLSYWATELLLVYQTKTKLLQGSKVVVQFSVSFYLVTAAGAMAVLAAACNLLMRHSHSLSSSGSSHIYRETFDPRDREHLLDDYDGMDLGMGRLAFYPPPPPYSAMPQNNV